MARSSFRAHGPTETQSLQADRSSRALAALTLVLSACVSYEPAPLDVRQVLADLEDMRWTVTRGSDTEPSGDPARAGVSPGQLAAFAVTHNPSLRAAPFSLNSLIGRLASFPNTGAPAGTGPEPNCLPPVNHSSGPCVRR